eukprot:scaffold22701_cov123-Cylindrotheca_fusiformis.AAC.1
MPSFQNLTGDNTESHEDVSEKSSDSSVGGSSPSNRQDKLRKEFAKTRDNMNSLLSDDSFQLPQDGIEAFHAIPDALDTGMFDSDVFGDLDDD